MKKSLKKVLACFTAACMTISVGATAYAATFPDVTQSNYSWAVDAIESMAKEGIIKGYEDGTFNPAKTVSKLESLVLISRILGVNKEINEKLVNAAWETYGDEIVDYELSYGNDEIAYLLMKGVLSVDELEDYLDTNNRNDGLKRYEVAVLLTKALDASNSLSASSLANLSYNDTADIPAAAKKYVAYVTEQGLMQGMDGNNFAPNDTVTRAQAAVVLYKLEAKTAYEYKTGIVASIDPTTRLFKAKEENGDLISHNLTTGTLLRYNGSVIGINDIEVGYDSVLTYKDGTLYAIDFTNALIDETVYGSYIGSSSTTATGTSINLYVLSDTDTDLVTDTKSTYKLSSDCVITYDTNTYSLSSLKSGDYIKLTVKEGKVTLIEAQPKKSSFSGRVHEVIIDPIYKLSIEENSGDISEYLVSSDVVVKKNGTVASARDILAGDSVSLTLQYGRITEITATSKSTTKTGIISEVIISNSPRITLTADGVDTTYYMSNNAEINLSGTIGTFYDLRVGVAATVKLESDTIVSVDTTTTSVVTTWEGTVTLVNTSYRLLQIQFVDSVTGQTRNESLVVKSNASIVDYGTQKAKKISDIKVGSKINVTGSLESGVFEAGTVVIVG